MKSARDKKTYEIPTDEEIRNFLIGRGKPETEAAILFSLLKAGDDFFKKLRAGAELLTDDFLKNKLTEEEETLFENNFQIGLIRRSRSALITLLKNRETSKNGEKKEEDKN